MLPATWMWIGLLWFFSLSFEPTSFCFSEKESLASFLSLSPCYAGASHEMEYLWYIHHLCAFLFSSPFEHCSFSPNACQIESLSRFFRARHALKAGDDWNLGKDVCCRCQRSQTISTRRKHVNSVWLRLILGLTVVRLSSHRTEPSFVFGSSWKVTETNESNESIIWLKIDSFIWFTRLIHRTDLLCFKKSIISCFDEKTRDK